MNNKKLHLLPVLVIVAMLLTMLAGCAPAVTTVAPTTTGTDATTAPTTVSEEIKLPLTDTPVTISFFKPINRAEADFNNNAIWKEITKRTGIEFAWECPTTETSAQRLTLILASKQYPDVMALSAGGATATYPGGAEVGVDEGVLLDLKELMQTEAPLYWNYLSNNKSALRDATTDKGYLPLIYQIYQRDTNINTGIWCNVVRGDWLKDLNLEVPKTIADWHTVLTAFKEEKGATFPLPWMLGNNPIWAAAYGIGMMPFSAMGPATVNVMYPDADNKIKFGGIEQGFQDYLVTLSQWYKEGLFDRDFTTRGVFDLPTSAKLLGTGQSGVAGGFLGWSGMYMGANASSEKPDPDFELTACPAPVLNAGEKQTLIANYAEFLGKDALAITSACKTPELFMQLINYLSSPEGIELVTYGIEGDTFTMVDGKPTFTDKILKDTMGAFDAREVLISAIMPIDIASNTIDVMKQTLDAKVLEDAKIPADSVNIKYMYYSLNEDEASEFNDIMGDINTYVAENYAKAVMDPAVAAKWMEVQGAKLKEMGIERAIEICQGAWDRYLAKG